MNIWKPLQIWKASAQRKYSKARVFYKNAPNSSISRKLKRYLEGTPTFRYHKMKKR